jgi:ABC-type polysaccharide/polyol phosphate export permease
MYAYIAVHRAPFSALSPDYGLARLGVSTGIHIAGPMTDQTALMARAPVVSRLLLLWRYRSLLRNLVARDLKLRYRDSAIGFAWSLLNPLLMMLVFTVVFTLLLRSAPTDVPYPPFLLTAILAWNFFQISVLAGAGSVVGSAGLVTKVYFPREILPLAAVLVNGVNFLLAMLVLIPVTLVYGIGPDPLWIFFPVVLLSQALFTVGITFLVAGFNVFFRDTSYIVDFLLLAGFFLTPIFYDIRQVFAPADGAELGHLVLLLNPMASYVTSYREILLMHSQPDATLLVRGFVIGLVTCLVGYAGFVRMSRSFGDVL